MIRMTRHVHAWVKIELITNGTLDVKLKIKNN